MDDHQHNPDAGRLVASPGSPPPDTRESEAERFLRESGLLRRWAAQAMAHSLEGILADEGLHLRRVKQRGGALKLRIAFPPSRQPSLKPKLGYRLRALIKRTGNPLRQYYHHVGSNRSVTVWVVPD